MLSTDEEEEGETPPPAEATQREEGTVRVPRSPGQPPQTAAWHKGTDLPEPQFHQLALEIARKNLEEEMGVEQQLALKKEKKSKAKGKGKGKGKAKEGSGEEAVEGKKSKKRTSTGSSSAAKRLQQSPQRSEHSSSPGDASFPAKLQAYAEAINKLPLEARPPPNTRGCHNYTLTKAESDCSLGAICVRPSSALGATCMYTVCCAFAFYFAWRLKHSCFYIKPSIKQLYPVDKSGGSFVKWGDDIAASWEQPATTGSAGACHSCGEQPAGK